MQLSLDLRIPGGATCLSFDFAFYSEEFPDFVGLEFGEFNDTFIAELGPPGEASTFTIPGLKVVAANNIATYPNGDLITPNGFDITERNPDTGTTYDGSSGLLKSSGAGNRRAMEVVFSIMDLGNSGVDSAVFLDNFRWSAGPERSARPGQTPSTDGRAGNPDDNRGGDGTPVALWIALGVLRAAGRGAGAIAAVRSGMLRRLVRRG